MNRVAFLAILEQINKTHENSLSTSLYTAPSRSFYTLSLFHIFISQHILLFILTLLKQLCANFISQAFHVSLSFLSQQIPFQIQFIFCCHFQIIIEQITVKKQWIPVKLDSSWFSTIYHSFLTNHFSFPDIHILMITFNSFYWLNMNLSTDHFFIIVTRPSPDYHYPMICYFFTFCFCFDWPHFCHWPHLSML